jgi:hypothetical protein
LTEFRGKSFRPSASGISFGISVGTDTGVWLRLAQEVRGAIYFAEEAYHIREPQKLPLVMSIEEMFSATSLDHIVSAQQE